NRSNEVALKEYADELGVNYSYDDAALLEDADYVFLGTKPYDFDELADRIKPYIAEKNKFISIMAGLPISYIREKLASNNPIARIMPNTNAHVGHSVTRSEEHTSELQSRFDLVCRLLLEKKNT